MAVTCSMLSGSPVLGTSLEVMLGSLVPLGIIVASGEWFTSPRLVKGVLGKEGEEVLALVRSLVFSAVPIFGYMVSSIKDVLLYMFNSLF